MHVLLLPYIAPCCVLAVLAGCGQDNYHGRWTIMGQSFGGFCSATYLSFAPEGETPQARIRSH